jgi:hypothetical protein
MNHHEVKKPAHQYHQQSASHLLSAFSCLAMTGRCKQRPACSGSGTLTLRMASVLRRWAQTPCCWELGRSHHQKHKACWMWAQAQVRSSHDMSARCWQQHSALDSKACRLDAAQVETGTSTEAALAWPQHQPKVSTSAGGCASSIGSSVRAGHLQPA